MQTPPVDPDVADTAPSDPTLMPYVHKHIVTCLLHFVPRPRSPTGTKPICRRGRSMSAVEEINGPGWDAHEVGKMTRSGHWVGRGCHCHN
jgi:hypothetical protein